MTHRIGIIIASARERVRTDTSASPFLCGLRSHETSENTDIGALIKRYVISSP